MGALAAELMHKIHGCDVWAGFVPVMAPDLQGWNSTHPWLATLGGGARVILDVGTWKGGSTVFLAKAMKHCVGDGCVIGIDSFLGSVEHAVIGGPHFGLIPRRHGFPVLYEQFLTNVLAHEVDDVVVPLALPTDAAAELLHRLRITADLIHIDAAHDYEAVRRDVRAYWRVLKPGGTLLGDDYGPSWPGVVRAADEFATELGLALTTERPKWRLDKPPK